MNKQLLGKALMGIVMGAMAQAIKEVKEDDLSTHEERIYGRELTESERITLVELIKFDKLHGTNQAEVFKESIKYAVAQEKALQAEKHAIDTEDQYGGIPKDILYAISEKLGVPISDMRVVKGGELNLSDILGSDDETECTHCPSYAGGKAKDHLIMQLKEHEAEAERIRALLNS